MKKAALIFFSLVILFCVTIFSLFFFISKKTSRPIEYFPNLIKNSLSNRASPLSVNFMILGVDRRNDWLEKTETTDTIIFSQISPDQKIHLFSLPRDLWDYQLSAKINQIYPLSLKTTDKFSFIKESFSQITGQTIDHVVVLSTEDLKNLADLLGGVDIYLEKGFRDEKYPNEAYIENPNSKAPIYKTVEFSEGWNHLDSQNITEFVRSRKSADTAEAGGTDLGRIERQQKLINSLIDKLKNSLLDNPQTVFDLYRFWSGIEHDFTDQQIINLLHSYGVKIKDLSLIRHQISTGENPKIDLLYHPKKFINSQWVFIPQDKGYQALHQFISESLQKP
ncbi:LCP family protein [Candidatus Shapirobacteria bacterium]|nr:LCP family protein [Candidatus Shapirobacteria bacterium]